MESFDVRGCEVCSGCKDTAQWVSGGGVTSKWYAKTLCTKMCTNSKPPGLSQPEMRNMSSL